MSKRDFDTARMWANNMAGDAVWQNHVALLDESTLRLLDAQLKVQMRTFLGRRSFVEMLIDLLPEHECDCEKRWTTSTEVPHAEGCDRLKACTCERQWTGGGLFVLDHSPDCELRNWTMIPPKLPDPEGSSNETEDHLPDSCLDQHGGAAE